MTTMQPTPPGKEQAEPDFFVDPRQPAESASVDINSPADDSSMAAFGSRLRAAREAKKLSLLSCAHSIRLPVQILRQLEQGESEGLDSRVYLSSYIDTYGRFLGIEEAQIRAVQAQLRESEQPLVATGGISHSRFLFDRYATAATYVVFTLAIAVPTIWFGVRSTLDRNFTHLAPLDASPVAQQDALAVVPAKHSASMAATTPTTSAASAASLPQDHPLMASMAPFPNLGDEGQPAVAAPVADTTGGHSLSLSLNAPSWVEVTQQDGTRLAYGLLPAGTDKTWRSDQPLDVRIGNAEGAQVAVDGQALALDDYRHANVAHFRVQMADGKASATGF